MGEQGSFSVPSHLELTEKSLGEPIAYSAQNGELYSIKDYITSRLPEVAKRLGLPVVPNPSLIPQIDELNEDELLELVVKRISQSMGQDYVLTTGGNNYGSEDLISEVRKRTELGWRLMAIEKRSIGGS